MESSMQACSFTEDWSTGDSEPTQSPHEAVNV
jgi:hypothetical protein